MVRAGHSFEGVTEIAGVDNVARSNMEWWVENAGVDKSARRSSDHEQ